MRTHAAHRSPRHQKLQWKSTKARAPAPGTAAATLRSTRRPAYTICRPESPTRCHAAFSSSVLAHTHSSMTKSRAIVPQQCTAHECSTPTAASKAPWKAGSVMVTPEQSTWKLPAALANQCRCSPKRAEPLTPRACNSKSQILSAVDALRAAALTATMAGSNVRCLTPEEHIETRQCTRHLRCRGI